MSISRRAIIERLRVLGHSVNDKDYIQVVENFLLTEFNRSDDRSKAVFNNFASVMTYGVRDMMKVKGSSGRTGIGRVLSKPGHTVYTLQSIFPIGNTSHKSLNLGFLC